MIQRHKTHAPGTFALCSGAGCGREPKHIISVGSISTEPMITSTSNSSTRHALECARCNRSTGRHPNLALAIAEWGAAYTQGVLALRIVPNRRRTAA